VALASSVSWSRAQLRAAAPTTLLEKEIRFPGRLYRNGRKASLAKDRSEGDLQPKLADIGLVRAAGHVHDQIT
jgi:hypothetical protein